MNKYRTLTLGKKVFMNTQSNTLYCNLGLMVGLFHSASTLLGIQNELWNFIQQYLKPIQYRS